MYKYQNYDELIEKQIVSLVSTKDYQKGIPKAHNVKENSGHN